MANVDATAEVSLKKYTRNFNRVYQIARPCKYTALEFQYATITVAALHCTAVVIVRRYKTRKVCFKYTSIVDNEILDDTPGCRKT